MVSIECVLSTVIKEQGRTGEAGKFTHPSPTSYLITMYF